MVGAAVVVVGAVMVVVGATVVVVVVELGSGSTAPAGPAPMTNIEIMSNNTAPLRAATEARRGEDGRITGITLDRTHLRPRRSPLVLRTGIGGAATNSPAQQRCSIGRAQPSATARILQITEM